MRETNRDKVTKKPKLIYFIKSVAKLHQFLGLFYACLMALFFGLAQVYSRQLKELNTSLINASIGFIQVNLMM